MKKHIGLMLRLAVALAGLTYIGSVLDWTNKVELPAGRYQLSNGASLELSEPTALRVTSGDFNPISPSGPVTLLADPAADPPGTLTLSATSLRDGRDGGLRLRPGILTTLAHAKLPLLLLGLLLVLPIYPITAVRWWLLMRARDIEVTPWRAFRLTMVGCFFNYAMPGSTGGDVVKAYYAAKNSSRRADAVMTVVIDRVVGLLGLVVLAALAGLFVLDEPRLRRITVLVWVGLAAAVVASAVYFSPHLRRPLGLDWLLKRVAKPGTLLGKVNAAALAFGHHERLLVLSTAMSVPVHLCIAVSAVMAGHALGMTTPASTLMTVIPVLFLAAAVPVSYQGFGLMEYLGMELLARPPFAGPNQIVVMLVVIRLFQVFFSMFGSIFVVRGQFEMHPERAEARQRHEAPAPVGGSPAGPAIP